MKNQMQQQTVTTTNKYGCYTAITAVSQQFSTRSVKRGYHHFYGPASGLNLGLYYMYVVVSQLN